jgi:hypothetical protein
MNHAGAGRADEAQRIPDRDHQLAHAQRVRIARRGSGQAGSFHRRSRQIAPPVSIHDLARQAASIPKLHFDYADLPAPSTTCALVTIVPSGRPDHARPAAATPYLYRGAAQFFDDISKAAPTLLSPAAGPLSDAHVQILQHARPQHLEFDDLPRRRPFQKLRQRFRLRERLTIRQLPARLPRSILQRRRPFRLNPQQHDSGILPSFSFIWGGNATG